MLGHFAVQECEVADGVHHVEIYCRRGLYTLLWHGDRSWPKAVVMAGGAAGGLLGPADGAYHDIGVALAKHEIQTLRVGYRRPNDLEECILDMAAACDLANRAGAERFVTVGHSFGGAVAVGCAISLSPVVCGVVTLATQSAGCEQAGLLGDKPLLLLHGDRDELLPATCSEVVAQLAGTGEVIVLPGAGHLLTQAGDEVRSYTTDFCQRVLAQ